MSKCEKCGHDSENAGWILILLAILFGILILFIYESYNPFYSCVKSSEFDVLCQEIFDNPNATVGSSYLTPANIAICYTKNVSSYLNYSLRDSGYCHYYKHPDFNIYITEDRGCE